MTGFRIAYQGEEPIRAKPVKSKSYLAWLHELPCVITGSRPVEAAHVSYANPSVGAMGRGKSQKASDRWALPVSPVEHRIQTNMGDERLFWQERGIDPHEICLVPWGLWNERGSDATPHAERLIQLYRRK